MTTITLPKDLLVRSATRDDAQAIADMNIAIERAEYGEAETIVDDVFEFWDSEQVELTSNSCAITTSKGELIGYTSIAAQRSRIVLDAHTGVHPAYQDSVLGSYLLQFAEQRTKTLYDANPALPHSLYAWGFTAMTKELLTRHGYVIEHSDYTMRIQFDEAPATPEALQDVTIRPFVQGQEERAVYEVIAESFPDIDGKPYRPYDEWYENVFKKNISSFEPSMLYVAIADGQVVGVTLCRIYPEAQDGYIWQVAVRRAWRKHGIALQLLRTAFGEFYRRGVRHVELGVNSQNATGAHELYARAGMHKRSQVDTMLKTLS